MKKTLTQKITLAGVLFAIIFIMQIIKNVSAFISGPIINAAMVIATLQLGLGFGIAFSVIVPITSLLFAPASPIVLMAGATYGVTVPVIIIGNILLVLGAYFGKKHGYKGLALGLILGAVCKWLFMWGCADLIIKPLFEVRLGKLLAAVNKVFSTLQLYSGLLGIILIMPISKALERLNAKKQ